MNLTFNHLEQFNLKIMFRYDVDDDASEPMTVYLADVNMDM